MHFLGTLIALSIVGHHCCRSSWWLHGKTHTIERYEMHGFCYTPWERSWHGISHTAWFLPWGMGFVMLHDFFHVLPYMTLGKRWSERYATLASDIREQGLKCHLHTLKIGTRGYISPRNRGTNSHLCKIAGERKVKELLSNCSKQALLGSKNWYFGGIRSATSGAWMRKKV